MPLPRLILIADGFTDEDVARRTMAAVRAGVPWVHLRDHDAGDPAFHTAASRLIPRLHEGGARISVNTRLHVARSLRTGLHVGARGPSVQVAREVLGPRAVIGFSAHDPTELTVAADYYFFSPIFPTTSKPGQPGAGLDALRRAASATRQPVLALGGITPERVGLCQRAGAHGIAVLSGILHADDPATATRHYMSSLTTPHSASRTPQ